MRLEQIKKLGAKNLFLLLLGGILLLCCSLSGKLPKEKEGKQTEVDFSALEPKNIYQNEEERLISLLSGVEGAGLVDVMIVYQSKETPFSYVDSKALPEGVVIVTQGGKNPEVVRLLSDATEALFGIPKHKIVVLPMRKETEAME